MSSKKITVVVADDHPLYRDGVVRALAASGQIDVVAEAGDGRAALAAIREHAPGRRARRLPAARARRRRDRARACSGTASRRACCSSRRSPTAASSTRRSRPAPPASCPRRRDASRSSTACSPAPAASRSSPADVAAGLVAEIRLRKTHDAPVLTDREREILRLIAEGNSLPEIAKQLFLGVDDREDARPAPVREARRIRPCRRGGGGHAPRPARVAWPGSTPRSRGRRHRDRAARRVASSAGDRALRAGAQHPAPEPRAGRLLRHARAVHRRGASARSSGSAGGGSDPRFALVATALDVVFITVLAGLSGGAVLECPRSRTS